MATVFSHALVGCTIVSVFPKKYRTKGVYCLAALTAMWPDIDYLGFINRIPYDSLFGHRGLTHSVFFAALTGCLLMTAFYRSSMVFAIVFFLTTVSHGLLDAFTNGGLGVAFYAPYSTVRYFFPWQPIQVSPMGPAFFSERGLAVLLSEFYWIMIPCFFVISLTQLLKNRNQL